MLILYTLVILIIIIGLISYYISIYNHIQRLSILVGEGWSTINISLQKRYDLIPNLVQCVKGYTSHEKSIFEGIAASRAEAMSAATVSEMSKANADLSLGLSKLFAIVEAYPTLKASDLFQDLQNSLKQVEDNLVSARNYYNGCVRNFNQVIIIYPNVIVANQMKMSPREFFEINEDVRENVKVSF